MNKRQAALEQICRQFGVAILYSFGSRAAEVRDWFEENRDHLPAGLSDADTGVKVLTGKKWSVREKVQLAGALEELLGISRVDLACLSEAHPFSEKSLVGRILPAPEPGSVVRLGAPYSYPGLRLRGQ